MQTRSLSRYLMLVAIFYAVGCVNRSDFLPTWAISLQALPSEAPADGVSAIQLTLTLDTATAAQARFSTNTGTAVITQPTRTSDKTFVGAITSSSPGQVMVFADLYVGEQPAVHAGQTRVEFTSTGNQQADGNDVDTTTSSLTASPNQLAADGVSKTTLKLSLVDTSGQPLSGHSFTWTSTGAGNTFGAPTAVTDGAGTATTTLSSTTAEAKCVSANLDTAVISTTVAFIPGSLSQGNSSMSASPASLVADGNHVSTLTVGLNDVYGNAIPGAPVTLSSTGSNNMLSPQSGTAGSDGLFVANLTSTTAESKFVTATIGGVSLSKTVSFTASVPDAAATTLLANPSTLVADGTSVSVVTVSVRDIHGNPVSNQNVAMTSNGTGNTLTPSSGVTDGNGVFVAQLTSTYAEKKTVNATAAGIVKTTLISFVPGPIVAGKSTLSATPPNVTADGSSSAQLSVMLRDQQANAVSGQAVTFSVSGGNLSDPLI